MRIPLFLLAFSASVSLANAQAVLTAVQPSSVPAAILNAHNAAYPNNKAAAWMKQGNVNAQYVANFGTKGAMMRARYTNDGKQLTETMTYVGKQIPESIAATAKTKYPDFKLMSATKIKAVTSGKECYKVRLRKGISKLTFYTDASGAYIEEKEVPAEAVEEPVDESAEGGI